MVAPSSRPGPDRSNAAKARSLTWRRCRRSTRIGESGGYEGLPGVLHRSERDDVPAAEHRGEPDREHTDLALPRRNGQHVVAAMHQPGDDARDHDAAVLEDAASEAERGDHAEGVVDVVGGLLAAEDGRDVLREPSALTHRVLGV